MQGHAENSENWFIRLLKIRTDFAPANDSFCVVEEIRIRSTSVFDETQLPIEAVDQSVDR